MILETALSSYLLLTLILIKPDLTRQPAKTEALLTLVNTGTNSPDKDDLST